jgi:hypothetical protein
MFMTRVVCRAIVPKWVGVNENIFNNIQKHEDAYFSLCFQQKEEILDAMLTLIYNIYTFILD